MQEYKVINLEYLTDLSGGDQDFMVDMISTFLENVPGFMNEFLQLKSQKNWAQMQFFAHKSKSTFLLMGVQSLSNDSSIIEQMCKSNVSEIEIENLLNKMQPIFIAMVKELKHALNNIEQLNS